MPSSDEMEDYARGLLSIPPHMLPTSTDKEKEEFLGEMLAKLKREKDEETEEETEDGLPGNQTT